MVFVVEAIRNYVLLFFSRVAMNIYFFLPCFYLFKLYIKVCTLLH